MCRRVLISVLAAGLMFGVAGSALAAGWNGNGDGTSWSDAANWSSGSGLVPLTAGADTAVDIRAPNAAGIGDVIINLDAATANTFVDNTSGNFFSTRATDARNLTVNTDWGDGFTSSGMWVGQSSTGPGKVTINHTGGGLILPGATYFGRGSGPDGEILYDLKGGYLEMREPRVGARNDADADVTLRISGGTFDNITPTYANRRVYVGGWDGASATFEVSGTGTARIFDYRGDNGGEASAGTGGSTYFRVVGSQATIEWDLNFALDQDGKANSVNELRFVADAGGVSTITAFSPSATLRLAGTTTLVVDLSSYAGSDELNLFAYGRYDGNSFAGVSIIDPLNRGYQLQIDGEGGFTDTGAVDQRAYLYIPEPGTLVLLGLGGLLLVRRRA